MACQRSYRLLFWWCAWRMHCQPENKKRWSKTVTWMASTKGKGGRGEVFSRYRRRIYWMHNPPQDVWFGACWKTVTDVTTGLRRIKTKSGKIASLKDNIQICWKGLGWEECETRWTVLGHDLTITELANRLKDLIRMQHKYKWVVPEKPEVLVPHWKNIVFLGTATRQVR